jgi:hypothetical protein
MMTTEEIVDGEVQGQFNHVIGVVHNNGKLTFAFLSVGHDTCGWNCLGDCRPYSTENVGRLCTVAEEINALIVPEANGVSGEQLVRELMHRCPDRLFRRKNVLGGPLAGIGYYHLCNPNDQVVERLLMDKWWSDNPDEQMARYCALTGKTTELKMKSVPHLCVENSVPDLFHSLMTSYVMQQNGKCCVSLPNRECPT